MLQPSANSWGFFATSTNNPAQSAYGVSVTPGNNSKGSYAQLLTALAEDVYFIEICFNDWNTSATARDTIADIGVDPAGGSSYSVVIPDLLASSAGGQASGIRYCFPLFIKAGSTVAARASTNGVTTAGRVMIRAVGKPSRPDLISWGTYVNAYGATPASSSGTAITPGSTNAEGSYVSLGSPSRPHWWWQVGMGINDSTMTALGYHLDLAVGDATNKKIIIENSLFVSTAAEAFFHGLDAINCTHPTPVSDIIYVRATCSGTPDASISTIAYGLG